MPIPYVGARGRLEMASLAALSPSRYAIQPKIDGMYVTISLDREGRVGQVATRSGAWLPRSVVGHLVGERIGRPLSILAGELEAHTDRGRAAAAVHGARLVHLFDCLRDGAEDLAARPYRERRDRLYRGFAAAADEAPAPDRDRVAGRRTRLRSSGRYAGEAMSGTLLTPIVPQVSIARASDLWDRALAGDLEGLVVVDLRAPAGRGKRKVKPSDTIDAVCESVSRSGAVMRVRGSSQTFAIGHRAGVTLRDGATYECEAEGRYATGALRFARVVRERADL